MAGFIYITKDYEINGHTIRCNEVGMVISKNDENSLIQFIDCNEPIEIPNSITISFEPKETGDQCSYKVCNRCNRLLPVEYFEKNQNGKNNRTVRRPSCIDCRHLINGKSIPQKVQDQWNKTKPHMVIWECPICKKRTIPGLTSKIVLDHNHKTGTPNGWICDSCNTGLGRFKDDVATMEEAIKYLKKHQQ